MTIYLAQLLLAGSCELPNLLLHQKGFTTPPCRHGARRVAILTDPAKRDPEPTGVGADQGTPHHFSLFTSPKGEVSIVSVALSLGFDHDAREQYSSS